VRDPAVLERIRALAIPPAYNDVWICDDPRGHLQATGRDARNRKQYRYHPDWKPKRDQAKFSRLVEFGQSLPTLWRRLHSDLAAPGLPRTKVLAIVVSLMSETLLRVGNDSYARANHSYGLTTLRNRHITALKDGRARIVFNGKSGQRHTLEFSDPKLVELIQACQELPGQHLFQYLDESGKVKRIDSGAVNRYLREITGSPFSAKDFRTWGATLLAFRSLAKVPLPADIPESMTDEERTVIQSVANALHNTPSVCRDAYIDPAVFRGWRDGSLFRSARSARGIRQWERALTAFLKRRHASKKAGN